MGGGRTNDCCMKGKERQEDEGIGLSCAQGSEEAVQRRIRERIRKRMSERM